jgi:hypothetical protein
MPVPETQSAEVLREWWLAPMCIDAFRHNCTGEVSILIVYADLLSDFTAGLIYIDIISFFNVNDVKSSSIRQKKWITT